MDGPSIVLRSPNPDDVPPDTASEFEDWGERDPAAEPVALERWVVEAEDNVLGTRLVIASSTAPTTRG